MSLSHETILITGASGFVGRALCHSLLKKGYKIRAIVRSSGKAEQLKQDNADFSHSFICEVAGDLIEASHLPKFFEGVETIIHLAARVHIMKEASKDSLSEYRRVNVDMTRCLAEKAAHAGVKRFIYLSSIKVNGEKSPLINGEIRKFTEQDKPQPEGDYAISKHEAEIALQKISQNTSLEVVILRIPLIYGKGVSANFEKLFRGVKKKMPFPFASVKNLRSLLYIENLCDFISLCIESEYARNHVFLVSDGKPISTPQLIKAIANALNTPSRLFPFPVSALNFLAWLMGKKASISRLTDSLILDDSKCRRLLNWQPPYSMPEALIRDFGESKP